MTDVDVFERTGHAELDDALALLERVDGLIDGAIGSLEDAHRSEAIPLLERAQVLIGAAAAIAR